MNIENEILLLIEQGAQEQKGIEFDAIRDAWINAGKPSTVQEIKSLFKQLGLTDEQITQTFDSAGYTASEQGTATDQQGAPEQGAAQGKPLDPKRQSGIQNLVQVASKEQLTQIYNTIKQMGEAPAR